MATVKTLLGVLIGFLNLTGLFATVLTAYAVYHIIQRSRSSSIYVMAATILSGDIIQLVLGLFYLTPSIIFESFLFDGDRDSPVVVFLGSCFLFAWYLGTISQVVVAVNRLVVLCIPKLDFFTPRRVVHIMVGLYPISLTLSLTSQYILPCCNFSFNHGVLSYTYRTYEGVFNYSNAYIDLWLNSFSSFVCLSSYAVGSLNAEQQKQRRSKEYRYAIQFLIICIFYLFSWSFFRLFPLCMPDKKSVNWFGIIAMTVALDSSANALVYLTTNPEVIAVLRTKMFQRNVVSVTEEGGNNANINSTTT